MSRQSLAKAIARFVGSRACFWLILGVFTVESAWITLSASYPMAFDEDFHFGIIKLYAQQWSPFFTHQPIGGNAYGALSSDPSYLYHYLMSFPYRLAALFTSSQTAQIIALRFIDVILVAWSLIIFRKILLKTKATPGVVHTTLLFFILVPVVPLLAAQINYDDLLLPLAALAILMTIHFKEYLQRGVLSLSLLLAVLSISMLASLVQFEFLPIFAAITLYIGYSLWQFKRHSHRLKRALFSSWHIMKEATRFSYIALFLVALGLFGQRYGTNLVAYKSPIPQCNQVMDIQACSAYIPWERNYTDSLHKSNVSPNPARYTANWMYGMFTNSFFTSSSGADTAAFYVHAKPLPIISVTAIAVFSVGIILFLRYREYIFATYPYVGFLLFVSALYCTALWLRNYHDFLQLGAAVSLNGRYLFPVIPLLMLVIGLAYKRWLDSRPQLKPALLGVVLVLFLQGGGTLTFIDASNPHWYWRGNAYVKNMNAMAQKIVKPVILD